MTIEGVLNQFFDKWFRKQRIYSVVGTVSDVNETTRTCNVTPIDGSAIRYDVRLQSKLSSTKGFVQFPKDGSKVIVTFLNQHTGFISAMEEVDKIYIDTDLVQFNEGLNFGVTKIDSVVSKLNAIETDLNTIKAAFAAWVVVPQDGGAALKAAAAEWYAALITPTIRANLEDTKITH